MITGENPEKVRLDRQAAWGLLTEFTQSESLRKHALAVEACMRAYARKFHGGGAEVAAAAAAAATDTADDALEHANAEGAEVTQDAPEVLPFSTEEEKWGITGLLHDFDYEKYPTPQEHPFVGNKILEERGYPEDVRRAILSHAEYSGVPRVTLMEKCLFACDELCGLITATALVKPNKSLAEVDAKSVRKRMKDKAFARSVSREDIVNGAQQLGVDLDQHIAFCIDAMQKIAPALGLTGMNS